MRGPRFTERTWVVAEGYPWWWVIGEGPVSGAVQHLRVNAPSADIAQIAFERSFPGFVVISVAVERYRNDDFVARSAAGGA